MSTATQPRTRPRGVMYALALLLLAGSGRPASASEVYGLSPEALHQQARKCEEAGDWLGACRHYDALLRRDRDDTAARRGYRRGLRRFQQVRRHLDPAYQRAVQRLSPTQGLDIYERVLGIVSASYVDRGKADLTALFRHGLEEVADALSEPAFIDAYLGGSRPADRAGFRARLTAWPGRKVTSHAEARERILQVVRAAREEGLRPQRVLITAISLEFAAGACNALDEYTLFLTPGHFSEAQAALEGKLVGVGLDLLVVGQHLEVARVHPKSPAEEVGLGKHDRLLRIDHQEVAHLPASVAAERLRGPEGTLVEVEVVPVGDTVARVYKLIRRASTAPSVTYEFTDMAGPEGDGVPLGLLRIHHFQESTPQEVKEAVGALQTGGALGLILDLRSNPGGLFKSAVDVADLFLPEGVIVYTRSQFPDFNRPYKAGGMAEVGLPVVVLVDGETASAAEMLAGALKDLGRARLVGQTTYGKGSIQCIIPLDDPATEHLPGGVRITVAKFFSPSKAPYHLRGVEPTDPCPPDALLALSAAKRILAESVGSGMLMGMAGR